MKYLVMENHFSYSIVLDDEGRFLKVANLNYEIGQRVDTVELLEENNSQRNINKKLIGFVGTVAACFILIFTIFLDPLYTQYGTVYLDINPSLQMEVNKKGQVLNINPQNEDGKKLLEDKFKWKRKDVKQVSQYYVRKSMEMGYLKDSGQVTISIDVNDDNWYKEKELDIKNELENTLKDNPNIILVIKIYGEEKDDDNKKIEIPINNESVKPSEGEKPKEKIKPTQKTKPKINKKDDDSGYTDYDDTDYDDKDDDETDYDDKKEDKKRYIEKQYDKDDDETDYDDKKDDTDYDDNTDYDENDDD